MSAPGLQTNRARPEETLGERMSAASSRAIGSSEWRVLELLALGISSESDAAEFDALIALPGLGWGEVLDNAIRHKVLHLLADQLTQPGRSGIAHAMICEHLRETLRVSQRRAVIYRDTAYEIASRLEKRGIPVACTKGIVLESSLYGGNGSRFLGDIDFMIDARHGEEVTETLATMGFRNGYLDRASGKINSLTRRDLIAYRLNPDHLPPFIREFEDPVVPHIHVDFACSFTWTSSPYQLPVVRGLANLATLKLPGPEGRTVPALNTAFLFIFTVLHLFREAYVSTWLDLGQDVNLMKFGDVVRSWRKWRSELATDAFRQLLEELAIDQPVGWVLVHTDRTFGLDIARTLGLENSVSEEFLKSGASRSGQEIRWRGTMLDRLQAANRRELLVQNAGKASG